MTKFYGALGYAIATETVPGVWEDVITERFYFGDILRNTRQLQDSEQLNGDLTTNNSISIVADAYALQHFFAIRYITWAGTLWIVENIEVQSPRLLLRLGGIYNGPKAGTTGNVRADSGF